VTYPHAGPGEGAVACRLLGAGDGVPRFCLGTTC